MEKRNHRRTSPAGSSASQKKKKKNPSLITHSIDYFRSSIGDKVYSKKDLDINAYCCI
jgi:hypothetical protein